MRKTRREFLTLAGVTFAVSAVGCASRPERKDMYGLIGKIMAKPGQRDALIAILIEGTAAMPGCLSYIVAEDPADAEAVWVTEAWAVRPVTRRPFRFPPYSRLWPRVDP